jgi:S-adenosylmethionine uptake transporter
MLAGMFLISINDMLIKSLAGGYPLHQIMFLRSALGIFLTFGILMWEGGMGLLRTGRPVLHVIRAGAVVLANSAIYAAVVAMPLATANAIYFVAPLFVMLLSIPVLGERVGPRRMLAALTGFIGVLVMILPEMTAGVGGYGLVVLLPIVAAGGYATASVLTRKLAGTSRASALAMHLHGAFLGVSLVVYLIAGDGRFLTDKTSGSMEFLLKAWVWPQTGDWPALLGLGAIAAIVGYLMSQAYRLARASVVAPFEYILLIYALFWGWFVFAEWPEATVFIGATIVIASGVYVFARAGQLEKE